MRILIADAMPDAARLELQAAGLEVHVDARLSGPALTAAIAAWNSRMVRAGPLSKGTAPERSAIRS